MYDYIFELIFELFINLWLQLMCISISFFAVAFVAAHIGEVFVKHFVVSGEVISVSTESFLSTFDAFLGFFSGFFNFSNYLFELLLNDVAVFLKFVHVNEFVVIAHLLNLLKREEKRSALFIRCAIRFLSSRVSRVKTVIEFFSEHLSCFSFNFVLFIERNVFPHCFLNFLSFFWALE